MATKVARGTTVFLFLFFFTKTTSTEDLLAMRDYKRDTVTTPINETNGILSGCPCLASTLTAELKVTLTHTITLLTMSQIPILNESKSNCQESLTYFHDYFMAKPY